MVEQETDLKRPFHRFEGDWCAASPKTAGFTDVRFVEGLFSGMGRPLDPLLRQAIARDCADLDADKAAVYRAALVGVLDAARTGERAGAARDLWRVLTGVGIGGALGALLAFSVSPWVCLGLLATAVAGALVALGPKNPAEIALGAHRLALGAAFGDAIKTVGAHDGVCSRTRDGAGKQRIADRAALRAAPDRSGRDTAPPLFVRNWSAMKQPALADMSRMPSGRAIGGRRGPATSQ